MPRGDLGGPPCPCRLSQGPGCQQVGRLPTAPGGCPRLRWASAPNSGPPPGSRPTVGRPGAGRLPGGGEARPQRALARPLPAWPSAFLQRHVLKSRGQTRRAENLPLSFAPWVVRLVWPWLVAVVGSSTSCDCHVPFGGRTMVPRFLSGPVCSGAREYGSILVRSYVGGTHTGVAAGWWPRRGLSARCPRWP